jgi:hypothetical protein
VVTVLKVAIEADEYGVIIGGICRRLGCVVVLKSNTKAGWAGLLSEYVLSVDRGDVLYQLSFHVLQVSVGINHSN